MQPNEFGFEITLLEHSFISVRKHAALQKMAQQIVKKLPSHLKEKLPVKSVCVNVNVTRSYTENGEMYSAILLADVALKELPRYVGMEGAIRMEIDQFINTTPLLES